MALQQDLIQQGQGLVTYMEEQVELLGKKRMDQAQASLAAEKAKDNMLQVHRQKTLEFSLLPEVADSIDPKTNKANKDWAQYKLDELLESDKDYITAIGGVYKYQEELTILQAEILDIAERVGVSKASARLISAMLGVLAGG